MDAKAKIMRENGKYFVGLIAYALAFVGMGVMVLVGPPESKTVAIAAFVGLGTAAAGYMFGQKTAEQK